MQFKDVVIIVQSIEPKRTLQAGETVTDKYGIRLSYRHVSCLFENEWVNDDEVINVICVLSTTWHRIPPHTCQAVVKK